MPANARSTFNSIELNDGRTLAFATYGCAVGRPLYFFHGFPGSRLQAALVHEPALEAGVCLVAIDRPGFGRSTHAPARTIIAWPRDVAALADHLGHRQFGVLGVSCGGPYALACAHELPDRISYVGLLAGIGPMDVPAIRLGQLPILKAMFALARVHPALVSPLLAADLFLFRKDPLRAVDALKRLMTVPDQALLNTNATVRDRFGTSLAEAYRQGLRGPLLEAHLIASPRGFRMEDIALPVHVFQGGHDRNVPPAMGEYIAKRLPRGRYHFYPDEGHLSILMNTFSDCLRHFGEAMPASRFARLSAEKTREASDGTPCVTSNTSPEMP
jgi:pimeloyl-ACP methyl ester carboxylesterase